METVEIGNLRWVVAPQRQRNECVTSSSKLKPKAKHRKRFSQAKQIFARARMYGASNVRKVGDGAMIEQSIETNGWLVMPKNMYGGIIPRKGLEIAEALTEGIPIKGFVVADDKRAVERRLRKEALVSRLRSIDWANIASTTGRVAGAIAVVAAVISFLPALLLVVAIGGALAYDPLLIAVTEEDEWVCVYEWWH